MESITQNPANTFTQTIRTLREQQAAKVDVVLNTGLATRFIVPASDGAFGSMRMAFETPGLSLDGQDFHVTDHTHRQIAERADVPWKFYDRMRQNHPDLVAHTLNTLWTREPENRLVRTLGNGTKSVRAWLSDRYRVVDNLPFLEAAMGEAEKHHAMVYSANVDETRLHVKMLTPRQVTMKVGDVAQAGVIIKNSEVGDGRIEVSPFIHILRCTNGLIGTKNYTRIHLGHALEDGVQSLATQEKESEFIFSAIQDWLRFALAPENMDEIVAQFERADEVRVTTVARLAVANVARFASLNKTDAQGVLERYLRADHDTMYTLVNAVTEQAHTVDDRPYRRQVELEALGGKLLEMESQDFLHMIGKPLKDKEVEAIYSAN